ncbi:MAG TPA: hypothetical protein HA263_10605 [Methanoregulaceae archaeon]|nr:hypothetical protein [Methanoregulaceae archaeon]
MSMTATSTTWAWTGPTGADFAKVEISVKGVSRGYIAKGVQSYTLTGLKPNAGYTLDTRTYDTSGNGNPAIVSSIGRTSSRQHSFTARSASRPPPCRPWR